VKKINNRAIQLCFIIKYIFMMNKSLKFHTKHKEKHHFFWLFNFQLLKKWCNECEEVLSLDTLRCNYSLMVVRILL